MASYQVTLSVVVAMSMVVGALGQYHRYYRQPQHQPEYEHEEYAEPKYSFEYEIKDEHTGDYHGQQETRDGYVVKGSYNLIQPDGKKRIVEYTSDHKTGFNAIVHYEPVQGYKAPEPHYEAPTYKYAPQPIKYQAPRY